jgi:hypothetical protein
LRACDWRQQCDCQRDSGDNRGQRQFVSMRCNFGQLHKLLLKGVPKNTVPVSELFPGIFYSHRRPARDSARQFIDLARFQSFILENSRRRATTLGPRSRKTFRRHLPIRGQCCSMNLAAKTSTARREKQGGGTDGHGN